MLLAIIINFLVPSPKTKTKKNSKPSFNDLFLYMKKCESCRG